MAKIDNLGKFILSFEGGFVNNKNDKGGATNKGVTLATWKSQGYDKDGDGDIDVDDLKVITEKDAINILKKNYWNKCNADRINDQAVADMLVDFYWCSGINATKHLQRLLGCKDDGIIGNMSLTRINQLRGEEVFNLLKADRIKFLNAIVANKPSQKVFLKGWLNRVNSMYYDHLVLNDKKRTSIGV